MSVEEGVGFEVGVLAGWGGRWREKEPEDIRGCAICKQ